MSDRRVIMLNIIVPWVFVFLTILRLVLNMLWNTMVLKKSPLLILMCIMGMAPKIFFSMKIEWNIYLLINTLFILLVLSPNTIHTYCTFLCQLVRLVKYLEDWQKGYGFQPLPHS